MSLYEEAAGRLAAELSATEAPPHIEQAVLAEFERSRRSKRRRYWMGAAAAVAAIATMVIVETRPSPSSTAPPNAQVASEAPFVPIPYVLPPSPYERLEIVRMQIPVAALIAAGLPVQTADPAAQAEADVLIGQDGRPRAVRLVSSLY